MIYGQLEQQGIAFAGVNEALRVPQSDVRLFTPPYRRNGKGTDEARQRAKLAAGKVRPVKA